MKRRVGDSEEIDLVLELSTDLDEEELPARKKKPKISTTPGRKERAGKGQERHLRVLWTLLERNRGMIFRQKLQELTPGQVDKRKNIAEIKQMEDELLKFDFFSPRHD